ncbi:MAG: SNF2 helicase associated domain-containing protein, partial [Anaerovorax sp.]
MQTSKKKTDYEAKLLMRAYSEKAKMGIQTESAVNQQGKVHIVPKLVIESASVFLEMTLGIERQYVVKSMQSFCQNMKNGEIVNYGKQLTLLHQMKVFHEDAKPLVRFIMNRYDEAQNLVGNRYNYYTNMDGLYSRGKKGMKLSPAAVDDFLAMYRNQRITVNFSGLHDEREEYIANLREGNPKIDIYVEEKRGEESFLFQTGKIKFLEGAAHLYLIFKEMDQEQDTILWQCDEEYRERMKPFIHAIGKGGSEFTVDKEDMADFCGEVLSEVRENIHLSGDVDLLSAYIPQEMTPIICLDCPQGNVITAVALCRYGNVEIDLYNTQANLRFHEQTGGETLIVRDTKGEFRIKMELSRYFDGYHRAYGALFFDGDNDRVFDFVRNGAPALSELAEIRAT